MSTALFFGLIQREYRVYIRKPSQILNPLIFFLLIITLFPMGMSLENSLLQKIAPGLVWLGVLLSSLLSLDRVFYQDYESGILEQQLISNWPMLGLIYAKLVILYLVSTIPLLLLTPIIAVMYGLSGGACWVLCLSLICGTPILLVLLVALAAMVLAAGNRGGLVSLIFLPLTIPVLIFGSGSVLIELQGVNGMPIVLILLALSMFCLSLGPFLIRKSLYLSVE